MKKNYFQIALSVIVGAFVLGACGPAASKATPTSTPISIEAIQTAAAQTVIAQLTQQAPTITPTPAFTNTPNVTATPTLLKPTPTKPVPTAASCANMTFLSDVTIPDGTQMPAGTAFTKTWKVQNSGTCEWTSSFKLIFSSGNAMGGKTVTLPASVAIGDKVNISVDLIAPNNTGTLTGVWVLVDDKGQRFGPTLTVVINVGATSPTPTGSATAGPTQTKTPKPSKTPSETPVPSETPTETLVPTV